MISTVMFYTNKNTILINISTVAVERIQLLRTGESVSPSPSVYIWSKINDELTVQYH